MRNNIIKNNQTFIIAEIGNNHEGNLQLAKKMIQEAWKCGVNAIKLQHIIPENFFAEKKQIKKYKKFQFTDKQIESLIKFSKKKDFIILDIFDFESFEKYKSKVKAFKISSTDNNFFYFIEKIIKEKKTNIYFTWII